MTRRLIVLALLLGGTGASAAQTGRAPCDREGTTSIVFGRTGGNLRPSTTTISPDGAVRRPDDEERGPVLGRVPRDSVLAISRRGWRGGFAALPPSPRRPPHNPDESRPYIELRSACGMHHVEYVSGAESRLFRELYARLSRLTARFRR